MIRQKAVFRFRVVLVVAVVWLMSPSTADDVCIWCDLGKTHDFLDCMYVTMQQSQQFGNLPQNSIDDMINSMIAAAGAITKSSESMKMNMMNGALAGEIKGLIGMQSGSQDREALMNILLNIVGKCFVKVSGQPHEPFTGQLGSTVNSMLSVRSDSNEQRKPSQNQYPPSPTVINGQNNNDMFQRQAANLQLAYQTNQQLASSQNNEQSYSVNYQNNAPQQPSYSDNQQKQWLFFYPPNENVRPKNSPAMMNYNQNYQPYPLFNQRRRYTNNQASSAVILRDNNNPNAPIKPRRKKQPKPPIATSKPPTATNKPPITTNKPSITTNKPPITTNKPSTATNKPPTATNKSPIATNKPPVKTPVTPATNGAASNGEDNDEENAVKFAETIYSILTKSNIFTGIFNKQLSNDDSMSIAFNAIQNALNDCGYSKYSSEMTNEFVLEVSALPRQSASEIYAEQLTKTLMIQFYKKKIIGNKPVNQGSSLAIAILKQLKQIAPSLSYETTTLLPTDIATVSVTTVPSTDVLVTTQASVELNSPRSASTNPNILFHDTLFAYLSKNVYFNILFSKDAEKSDAITWLVQMLINLSEDYGPQITTAVARKCAETIATNSYSYANIISNCTTEALFNSGLISKVKPTDQAKDIASKFNTALIKIINNNTKKNNNNVVPQIQNTKSPTDNSQPQDANYQQIILQNGQNIPNLNKQPGRNTGIDNYPFDNMQPYPVDNIYSVDNDGQTLLDGSSILLAPKQNQNSAAPISNQNNDYTIIVDEKLIPIDNSPAAQFFPDGNSDASKQRIQVLIKSIQNGKFNYKIFSNLISALAKHAQRTNPNLSPQNALIKVLLEIIMAFTQLLEQVPPNSSALKNDPNNNSLDLQNANAPPLQNANVPPLKNANVLPLRNAKVPPLQNENETPPFENANIPPNFENANIPPPFENANIPPSFENANIPPPFENANIPPNFENANIPPPFENANIPPSFENANTPPPFENANTPPPFENANIPNINSNVPTFQNIPPLQIAYLPPIQNTDVNTLPVQSASANNLPLFQNGPNENMPFFSDPSGQISVEQSIQEYPGSQHINYNDGQNFDAQQQTNWNNGYVIQQGSVPSQGNFVFNGQNNFPPSPAASGIQDINGNWNGQQLGNNWATPQGGFNGQNLQQNNWASFPENANQQTGGSFLNGNPNQNEFPQGLGMQEYQGNW